MTNLATIQDVKRVIGSTDPNNNLGIQAALSAAESWVRRYLGKDYNSPGATITAKFYSVRDDAILELPDENCTITAVRIYPAPNSTASSLTAGQYETIRSKKVQLQTRNGPFPVSEVVARPGHIPQGGALGVTYSRVEVDYTTTGVVPAAVKEATAIIAGAFYTQAAAQAGGFTSETLGDYSYSMAGGVANGDERAAIPPLARVMLKPFRRSRVTVV